MNKYICENRKTFIDTFSNELISNPSGFYFFYGKNGTGKKYVLNELENNMKKKFKIYRITSDVILEKNQNVRTHTFDVSFTLNSFIGFSLAPQKNDSTKINYIISNLKTLTLKKNIMISAVDYDELSSESRDFVFTLVSNKKLIEEKIKKRISVIITGRHDYFNGAYDSIKVFFEDYTREDLYNYLIAERKYQPAQITDSKLNQIYKLCGTNFNLANCYCNFILEENIDASIEAIIDKKLNYYISAGYKYNLTKVNLENILYTSSLCIDTLTPKMVSYINDEDINTVETGFKCAVEEYFLDLKYQNIVSDHLFISKKEKDHLCKYELRNHKNKLIHYYNYLSNSMEDEYLERAQFLYKFFSQINQEIFSLLILAISKSYLLNDSIARSNIKRFFNKNNVDEGMKSIFFQLCLAYEEHYSGNYKFSNEILRDLNFANFNIVLAAELRRLQFKNGQLGRTLLRQEMEELTAQLHAYVENGLVLINENDFNPKEEKLLSLRIIFDIAPYILDSNNDKELFSTLYEKSLLFVKYINEHFVRKSYSEYIINVFNRKAFLFAAPSVALLYYEEAEAYFRNNKIWEEYVVTLASKAGISIDLQKYTFAINDLRKAIEIINENKIEIQQIEKIYNNLYIAEFLDFEQNNNSIRINREYAKITIQKLEDLLTDKPCGTNHVILTNLASLYLYTNSVKQYSKVKKRIEASLRCQDVADLHDITVNDFYRYHFAWYEFYVYLMKEEWKRCMEILKDLNLFYPSIFHNYKKMDLRVEAALFLTEHKLRPTTLEFCLKFLNYAPSYKHEYYSRGLLLSDLQFTSLE